MGKSDEDVSLVGQTLDNRYRVTQLLGSGGMAVVYQGLDTRMRRDVAIKVLRPGDIRADAHVFERFDNEVNLLASKLDHPNIVTVYDRGEVGSPPVPYLVMQLVRGGSWLSRYRGAPANWRDVFALARQATSALAAAHTVGVIHRDLKPDNLLVDEQGVLKVIDFGVAHLQEELSTSTGGRRQKGPRLTTSGQVVGTFSYMSIEQMRGELDLDGRADVYALGVVLYRLLTQRPRWRLPIPRAQAGDGDVAELKFIVSSLMSGDVVDISERRRDLPADVAAVVRKAVSLEAKDRYQTMEEFQIAIETALRDDGEERVPTQLKEISLHTRDIAELTPPAVATDRTPAPKRGKGSVLRTAALAGLMAVVGAAAGVGIAALANRRHPPVPIPAGVRDTHGVAASPAGRQPARDPISVVPVPVPQSTASAPAVKMPPSTAATSPQQPLPAPAPDVTGNAKSDARSKPRPRATVRRNQTAAPTKDARGRGLDEFADPFKDQ